MAAVRLNALNATRGVVLADHARIADNLWTRLVGLLRDKHLDEGDGLGGTAGAEEKLGAATVDLDDATRLSRLLELSSG